MQWTGKRVDYTQRRHKLRFFKDGKAQFVTMTFFSSHVNGYNRNKHTVFIVISKGETMNKIQRTFIFLTIVPILLSACGGRGTVKEAQSSRAREKNPNISAADSQALVEGNNTFALNLYQALRS